MASSFRSYVGAIGIRAADDRCQPYQWFMRAKAKGFHHHVEGAAFPAMAPKHALIGNVEGLGALLFGDGQHFPRCYEQEARFRIHEPTDQPWASDTIDLGSRACDPPGSTVRVPFRQMSQ